VKTGRNNVVDRKKQLTPLTDLAAVGDEGLPEHQSGMFPCFSGGTVSLLVESISSAWMMRG
jgi:hypothetical protein